MPPDINNIDPTATQKLVQLYAKLDALDERIRKRGAAHHTQTKARLELLKDIKKIEDDILGVEKEDVEIVAELASEDEGVAQAVEEFVERAVENAGDSSQEYTFADAVTEVQLEAFMENPIGELTDIDFSDVGNIAEIGNDLTQDQKDKAKEVVVPVIIVSQIISAGSIIPIRKIR